MNRPLLWAAVAFTAGIWLVGSARFSLWWLPLIALVLLALHAWPGRLPYRDGFLLAFVFLVAGTALEFHHRPLRQGDPLSAHNRRHIDAVYTLEGTIAEAPIYTPGLDYMSVRVAADRVWVAGRPTALAGRVVVRWSEPTGPLHPGERIHVQGRLDPVLGEVNIGHRGVEDYYRTHGYHSTMRIRGDQLQKLSSPGFHIRYWASQLRHWESRVFAKAAPADIQPFLRAVWLGDRAGLAPETYRPYLQTGAAHILAVSGLHVGIVYLSLHMLLRTFIRNRKIRTLIIMLAIVVFALITGGGTPIFRATLMLGLYLCAELLDREPDAPTALSIAAMLFLVHNPGLVRDTGFVLSFTSLGSLLLFSGPIVERLARVPRLVRQNIGATLGVSILPLPLAAHFFHVIPIVGPLCNLAVIPLLTAVLLLCLAVIVLAPVSIGAAGLFGHALAPVVHAIQAIVTAAAALPLSHLTVTSPTFFAYVWYGIAIIALACLLQGGGPVRRWSAVAVAALLLAGTCWRPLQRPATLDFLDVSHGDATFVRTPGGSTLLIDAGNQSEYVDLGERVVVPWLLANGVNYLDYVVVTHPDQDHIGGIPTVLDAIDVGQVILWPEPTDDPTELALVGQCRALGVPLRRVSRGEHLAVDGAEISVLHPAAESSLPGINNRSIVLQVQWPGLNALLTGDIEAEAERALLSAVGPVDVLKAPHHGSHTSSTAAFLDATSPQLAVISTRHTGRRQAVGRGVLPRYEARNIAVYRTDYLGGIQIRSDGTNITVENARQQRGYSLDPVDN